MTPERWRVVKSIVQEALARPAAERPAFIEEACGDDAPLHAEVGTLLDGPDTTDGSDDFLSSPALAEAIASAVAATRWKTLATALAGQYDLERELGRGGMATVYLARDLRHRRRVALKVLHPELGARVGPRRFRREIETAANLSHPHILPLFDSGAAGELLWYVMPYVAGESLRHRLRHAGRMQKDEALRVLREVAAALDYAHRHGVVHRDVKPENILLDEDGHALVADFGIASADPHDTTVISGGETHTSPDSVTERGLVIGTPAYMSPEQASGRRELDGRSDEYSLACVVFELLAGSAPFTGTSAEQLAQRPTQAPPSLLARRPDLPRAAEAALGRALALDPEARYDTACAFAEALATAIADTPSDASRADRTPHVDPVAKPDVKRSTRRLVLAAGTGLLVASALAATLVVRERTVARVPPAPSGPPVVAVLPFGNLGPPSDAYFADALTDEITGRLATLSGLRVISGASTRQYKGSTKRPREIARELGATHLLTGTVRWEHAAGGASGSGSAGRVRVRSELVRAADEASLWTEPVEGSLEDVVFVQASVAERVATSLDVVLLERERDAAAAPPTRSVPAYEAYLRAVATREGDDAAPATARQAAIAELDRAVALDPNFAAAYARRALEYGGIFLVTGDPSVLAQMRANVDRAYALDSALADSRLARVGYLIFSGDLEGAARVASALVAEAPSLAKAYDQLGAVAAARGDVDAAIASYQRAWTLDPRSLGPVEMIAGLNQRAYRYAKSVRYRERHLALQPGHTKSYWMYMMCHLAWRADTASARRVMERGGPALERMLVRMPNVGGMAMLWHQVLGPAVWRAKDTLSFAAYSGDGGGYPPDLYLLTKLRHFALTGRRERMRAYADSAVARLEPALRREPDVTLYLAHSRRTILAEAYARLGRTADADREIDHYLADARRSRALWALPNALVNSAYVAVLTGRRDAAVARLAEALRLPGGIPISPALLRADSSWAPLRGHPGFERLIAGG